MFHKTNKTKMLIMPLAILLLSSTIVMATSNSVLPPAAYAITFEKTKNLSNNDGDSLDPQIDATGNNVYTVWSDSSEGDADTFFKRSATSGDSFQSTKDLSNGKNGEAFEQHIAKEGNNVYVVWSEDGDIFFKRSTNNGQSFGSTVNLSNDPHDSRDPDIASIGSKVYVTWIDTDLEEPDNNEEIFFKRSTNEGSSFGSTIKNIHGFRDCLHAPQIDATGNNVYITYNSGCEEDQRVDFVRSTNNGASFSDRIEIVDIEGSIRGFETKAFGSNVYIVWSDSRSGGSDDTFLRKSTNNGASFGNEVNLSNNEGSSFDPDLDVTGKNVYVSWVDDTPGNNDIFFRKSTNEGNSFASTMNLSNNEGNSDNPQISSLGTAVRIVWQDDTQGNSDIFFKASGNRGESFGSTKNLSNNNGGSFNPMIISAEDNVYTVWSDDTPGNSDIFFKKGVD
jgi:hypothetical protein